MEGLPSPSLALPATPKRLVLFVVGVLFAWTAFIGIVAHATGAFAGSPIQAPHRSLSGLSRHSALGAAGDLDDQLGRQWTEKLLNDLQSSATDTTVAATLAELRSTLEARDDKMQAEQQMDAVMGCLPLVRQPASSLNARTSHATLRGRFSRAS